MKLTLQNNIYEFLLTRQSVHVSVYDDEAGVKNLHCKGKELFNQ